MRNKKGYSLVSTIVAIGISLITITAAFTAILKISQGRVKMNQQSDLDLSHLQTLQILNNSELMQQIFFDSNPQIKACFRRSGTQCSNFGGQIILPRYATYGNLEFTSSPCPISTNCKLQRDIRLTLYCSNESYCEKGIIEINTSPNDSIENTHNLRSQSSKIVLSSRSGEQRREFNFTCPNGNFLSGLNFETLEPNCTPLVNTHLSCTSGYPLIEVGEFATNPNDCFPNPVNANCANGIGRTSLYSGSEGCTSILNVSPDSPLPPVIQLPPPAKNLHPFPPIPVPDQIPVDPPPDPGSDFGNDGVS